MRRRWLSGEMLYPNPPTLAKANADPNGLIINPDIEKKLTASDFPITTTRHDFVEWPFANIAS
jgi:hypothetical protein